MKKYLLFLTLCSKLLSSNTNLSETMLDELDLSIISENSEGFEGCDNFTSEDYGSFSYEDEEGYSHSQKNADDNVLLDNSCKTNKKQKITKNKRVGGSFTLPLECGHVFMEGEYLYWKPYAVIPWADFRRAIPPFESPLGSPDIVAPEDIFQSKIDASSGYRLNVGFYLPRKTWYTEVAYTQLAAKGTTRGSSKGLSSNTAGIITEDQGVMDFYWTSGVLPATNEPVDGSTRERLNYKIIDADLARTFITTSCFTLDPYLGVRYARIKVSLMTDYKFTPFQGNEDTFGFSHLDINNNLNSFGLRVGMKANWMLGCGFEIFGNTSLSALTGTFLYRIRDDVTFPVTTIPTNRTTITTAWKTRDIQTALQIALGLNWGTHCRCSYFGIKLGYEINVWPDFISVFNVGNSNANRVASPLFAFQNWVRRLAMQGLTASLRFDF